MNGASYSNAMNHTKITVRVPATSANMGPGFDCLGIALDIWNSVTVEVGQRGFQIHGHGENELPRDESNLVWSSIARIFNESGRQIPGMSLTCYNGIPTTRGLGSSSAALVAGLVAGNELCDNLFDKSDLLQMAADVEGHPDNVAPALFGGMQIAAAHEGRVVNAPVPVPENLSAVLYVPDSPMPTEEARVLLGSEVPRTDAVFNIARAALLVRAMASGDLRHLDIATEDRLHQPARQTIFFPMNNIIRAAMGAGALGAFLSGAGSTVLAFATEKEFTIGYEMADAAVKSGLSGEVVITSPTNFGAHILE